MFHSSPHALSCCHSASNISTSFVRGLPSLDARLVLLDVGSPQCQQTVPCALLAFVLWMKVHSDHMNLRLETHTQWASCLRWYTLHIDLLLAVCDKTDSWPRATHD